MLVRFDFHELLEYLDVYDLQELCFELGEFCAEVFHDIPSYCDKPLFVKTFESAYSERLSSLEGNVDV